MKHELDRPAWAALTSRHAGLAEVRGGARRYRSGATFAGTRDDAPEDVAALGELIPVGQTVVFPQADVVVLPANLRRVTEVEAVQMLGRAPFELIEDSRIEPLGWNDAEEMLALVTLTRPGPFTARALELGRFWGVRQAGRIVAMAGERMSAEGFTELSGVCTHPDVRGQGLGRLMSRYVSGQISAKGDTAFLHCFAANATAIGLYESIGFAVRTPMHVVVAERPA
jgi:ribosomal protein S18 acetylase RimI-like enzyme